MNERTKTLRAILTRAAQTGRIAVTGHERADADSVISCVLMKRLLDAWQIPAVIALHGPDKQSRRVLARFGLDAQVLEGTTKDGDWLILVDCHHTALAGNVIACVDHHPTDYPPEIPYAQIEESGACAVMVLRLMQEAQVNVTLEDEQLAVAALYLDTIALKSTKLTRKEAAWGESEAKRLGLDEGWLMQEGMGLMDMSLPDETLALLGKKRFVYGNRVVLSTYVQTDAMTEERLAAVFRVLRGEVAREQADLWVFLVHDPMRLRSMEYHLSPDGTVKTIVHDCLVSRGKDVMPRVERAMRTQENRKDGR